MPLQFGAVQRVQPSAWHIHVFGLGRSVQDEQLAPELASMCGLNLGSRACLEE